MVRWGQALFDNSGRASLYTLSFILFLQVLLTVKRRSFIYALDVAEPERQKCGSRKTQTQIPELLSRASHRYNALL